MSTNERVELNIAPTVIRTGTYQESAGAWFDANLVRVVNGEVVVLGGWERLTGSGVINPLTYRARSMLSWRDNSDRRWLAIATSETGHSEVVVGSPASLGDNIAFASVKTLVVGAPTTAAWSLDHFGEILLAVHPLDKTLMSWTPVSPVSGTLAAVTNAPTCLAVVVTPERFVMALGSAGNGRQVSWADQETLTVWTPTATNQAGDFILPGDGNIVAGRRTRSQTLIWTTDGLYAAEYVSGQAVYSFRELGKGCGLLGPNAVVISDDVAYWLSPQGPMMYNGVVRPIPCAVWDWLVGTEWAPSQQSYVFAQPQFNEIWFVTDARAANVGTYAILNTMAQSWMIGAIDRDAALSPGVFPFVIMISNNVQGIADKYLYQHDKTMANGIATRQDASSSDQPRLISGPLKLGNGQRFLEIQTIIPGVRLNTTGMPTTVDTTLYMFDEIDGSLGAPFQLVLIAAANYAKRMPVRASGRYAAIGYQGNAPVVATQQALVYGPQALEAVQTGER